MEATVIVTADSVIVARASCKSAVLDVLHLNFYQNKNLRESKKQQTQEMRKHSCGHKKRTRM